MTDDLRNMLEEWARRCNISNWKQQARTHKNCCVYIIECRGSYKIGKTGDINKRMKSLQTANPFPMQIVHVIFTENHHAVEQALHLIFADSREVNEWFNLSLREIAGIKSWSVETILVMAKSRKPKEVIEPVVPPDQMSFGW